jgi:hypothetical protein
MEKLNFMITFEQEGLGFYPATDFYQYVLDHLGGIGIEITQFADPRQQERIGNKLLIEIPYSVTMSSDANKLTIEIVRERLSDILKELDTNNIYSNLKIKEWNK